MNLKKRRTFEWLIWPLELNKAGYTATSVACGWAGAMIEVKWAFC